MKKIMGLMIGVWLLSSSLLVAEESRYIYVKVAVADADLNTDSQSRQTVTVTVTSENGEEEQVVLRETGNNTSRFTAAIPVLKTEERGINNDGKFYLNKNSRLKLIYVDNHYGRSGEKKTLEGEVLVDLDIAATSPESEALDASTGGGCSVNPHAKHFDLMFFMMLALTLLYPLRRRWM